jgi:hypothetical protein
MKMVRTAAPVCGPHPHSVADASPFIATARETDPLHLLVSKPIASSQEPNCFTSIALS